MIHPDDPRHDKKWHDYLTVLNVRNYRQTAKGVLTEMIYVHSKLTIVDDAVAIIPDARMSDLQKRLALRQSESLI